MSKRGEKFQIGTFEVTDGKGALSFSGFVTIGKGIKPLFLLNVSEFGANNNLSMAFSSIEMRSLANHLVSLEYDTNKIYRKYSGGSNSSRELNIKYIEEYTSFELRVHGNNHKVRVPSRDLAALGKEIELLVDETVSDCYLSQKARKKSERAEAKKKEQIASGELLLCIECEEYVKKKLMAENKSICSTCATAKEIKEYMLHTLLQKK